MQNTASSALFRDHKAAVLFAVEQLGRASRGTIKRYLDDTIDSTVRKEEGERYEAGNSTKKERDSNIKNRTSEMKISPRSIRYQLVKLEAQGLIERNEHYEYQLTLAGLRNSDAVASLFSHFVFGPLARLPLPESQEERFDELVKRFGVYTMFVFIKLSFPDSNFLTAINDYDHFMMGMAKRAIFAPVLYHKGFRRAFHQTKSGKERYKLEEVTFKKLTKILETKYPEILHELEKGFKNYDESEIFPQVWRMNQIQEQMPEHLQLKRSPARKPQAGEIDYNAIFDEAGRP